MAQAESALSPTRWTPHKPVSSPNTGWPICWCCRRSSCALPIDHTSLPHSLAQPDEHVHHQPGEFVGLRNYAMLFQDELFINSLGWTFVYTVSATLIETALGLAFAFAESDCASNLRPSSCDAALGHRPDARQQRVEAFTLRQHRHF